MSNQLADKVDDLVDSLDELEEVLGPLFETPLSKLTDQLSTPLDRAKLQVWLSYVLNDLIWIHLRTRGINPSNMDNGEPHDVVAELDRVKSYFAKIKEAEDPAKRTTVVDGKVANRFIKHALSSAISPANFSSSSGSKATHTRFDKDGNSNAPAPSAEPAPSESSSESDGEPEVGTWKAKKRAREADLANQVTKEGDELESDESMEDWEETNAPAPVKVNPEPEGSVQAKRPRMDPFAGYSQPSSKQPTSKTSKPSAVSSTGTAQPATNFKQQEDSRLSPASSTTPSTTPSAPSGKKTRRSGRGPGSKKHKKQPKHPSQASQMQD